MSRYIELDRRARENRAREQGSTKRFSRRAFILGSGAAGLAVLWKTGALGEVVDALDSIRRTGPTEEQQKAAYLFSIAASQAFIHELVVKGQLDNDGQVLPANFRNKPETGITYDKEAGGELGKIIDKFQQGTQVEKAIVVIGINPEPTNQREVKWYAFPHPATPQVFGFAYSGLFEWNPVLSKVSPFDLDKI